MIKKLIFSGLMLLIGFVHFAGAADQVGPIDTSGEINGAPYRIVVPAVWNGTLLVYAHGYRDKADQPGEVDNRNADIAPDPPSRRSFSHKDMHLRVRPIVTTAGRLKEESTI